MNKNSKIKRPAMTNIEKIRKAIVSHRGGLAEATDGQIIRLWNSLDEETREQYLTETTETGNREQATGNRNDDDKNPTT